MLAPLSRIFHLHPLRQKGALQQIRSTRIPWFLLVRDGERHGKSSHLLLDERKVSLCKSCHENVIFFYSSHLRVYKGKLCYFIRIWELEKNEEKNDRLRTGT